MVTNEEFSEFIQYIQNKSNHSGFVKEYLFSGLAEKRNLGHRLTSNIFRDYFYVSRGEQEESYITDLISQLHNDNTRNILGIISHGGSGKTTFIQMLSERYSTTTQQYVYIDFDQIDVGKDEFEFASSAILKRTRKLLRSAFDPNSTAEYQFALKNNLTNAIEWLNNYELEDLATVLEYSKEIIFDQSNIEITSKVNTLIRSLSFKNISDKLMIKFRGIELIEITCLLSVLIILSNPSKNKEYILVFDNIENLKPYDLPQLPTIIEETWQLIYNITSELGLDFCTKMTCLFVARDTTNIAISTQQNEVFWATYNLKYDDFSATALLLKLKFLYKYGDLKNTLLYKDLYFLCSLICPHKCIEEFLTSDSENTAEVEYKIFTKNKLAPFFGNNFRLMVNSLCGIIYNGEEQNIQRIRNLITTGIKHDDRIDNITINGARNILFYNIYQSYMDPQDNLFSYFGIKNIDGKNSHSKTRVLLAFLYWDKVKHFLQNNCIDNYSGISLGEMLNVFKYYFVRIEERHEFVELIYKLSQLKLDSTSNMLKAKQLSKWSYLIKLDIKDYSQVSNNEELITIICDEWENNTPSTIDNIRVSISVAGICFISNTSVSYEFFNARDDRRFDASRKPLFMLLNEKDVLNERFCFEINIQENYNNIKNFVCGMVQNGKNTCLYMENTNNKTKCQIATDSKIKNKYNMFNCSLFIRYVETASTVIETINYLDRYRIYLWTVFTDINIDNIILKHIENFAKLLEYIRTEFDKNDCRKKIDDFILELGIQNKNGDIFKKPLSVAYYKKSESGDDLIFEAIKHEKITHTSKSLYEICRDI